MAFIEAFMLAAPEMAPATTFAFAPEAAFGATEFGTAAAFDALPGLSALGATNAGILGALGGAGAETLAAPMMEGITSGGVGAGAAEMNAAQIAAQQAKAAEIANSGMQAVNTTGGPSTWNEVFNQGQNIADSAQNLGRFAEGPGGIAEQEAAQNATKELIQNSGQIPPAENLQGLEQVKEPPLSEAAKRTIEGAKTYGPAADPSAFYEDLIQQNVDPMQLDYSLDKVRPDMGGAGGIKSGLTSAQTQLPNQYSLNQGLNYASPISAANTTAAAPSALESGFNQAIDFAKKNPFSAASMAYTASNLLKKPPEQEKPAEYNGPLKRYKMSSDFKGRFANPEEFQYTPRTYAEGGIASYDKGGDIALDYWKSQQHQQANPPSGRGDPGAHYAGDVAYDQDPDTRYLDPLTAAQVRMAKINKRANMQTPGVKRPTPMGQINLAPPGIKAAAAGSSLDPETMAAHGGVMHSSLGGYAAGGNPRLLKGPGDGMSDNIPATISGKQPARLADGEFVVPADVVSHLGNGSTEAGAKILHEMMTKVRKERTGNPKQGKQINPRKFIPT